MVSDTQTTTPDGQGQLSQLPPYQGLQLLLRQHREPLQAHYVRFLEQGGDETLHDLRVSIRRLRSLLKNYRTTLHHSEALAEQLRAIQQQSNDARDLEVFIAQLQYHCPQQLHLIEPLQRQLEVAYRELRSQLPHLWQKLQPLLEQPLQVLPVEASDRTLGRLTHRLGSGQCERLKKGLKAVQQSWDEVQVHRLRIRGKQLRYLLEPFTNDKQVASAVSAMKRFQEELGDYRDLQLLGEHLSQLQTDESNVETVSRLSKAIALQVAQKRAVAQRYRGQERQQQLLATLTKALQQLRG